MPSVPSYQNFVPGVGHRRMPSAHEVQAAKNAGRALPEDVVNTEKLTRDSGPVKKMGYENFIPGPGHKLMPTWAQIQAAEAAKAGEVEPEPEVEAALNGDRPQCQECGEFFGSLRALNGHKKAHR